jgi:uncharacterized membrane protein YhiD involved in acid resistance
MTDLMPPETLAPAAWASLVTKLASAIACGLVVAWIYRATRGMNRMAASFPGTLVMLCVLIALVTQVIGGNVALAFSLVGALSIVRFRTVVQDTKDTAFVIFAVVVGMAIGAGQLPVALSGTAAVGMVAWIFRDRNDQRNGHHHRQFDVCVRMDPDMAAEPKVQAAMARHDPAVACTATRTTKKRTAVRAVYGVRLPEGVSPSVVAAELAAIPGVQAVDVGRTRASS